MVATATGVKKWCRNTFVSYNVKKSLQIGLESICKEQPPQ